MTLQQAQLISGRQGYDLFQTLKVRAVHVKEVNALESFVPFLRTESPFLSLSPSPSPFPSFPSFLFFFLSLPKRVSLLAKDKADHSEV